MLAQKSGLGGKRAKTVIFGQANVRQNLHLPYEFMTIYAWFQPGTLFKLLRIPLTELVHQYVDLVKDFRQFAATSPNLLMHQNAQDPDCQLGLIPDYL